MYRFIQKNFWSNSWNHFLRFLPPRTESFCPSLCGEWAEFGRIVLPDGFQLAYKAQILTQNANLPPRTCWSKIFSVGAKKIWPLCSKGQKSKTLGEENGTINWTKNFLDESKHKKAQFHKSVKYFTQKNWWCGQG